MPNAGNLAFRLPTLFGMGLDRRFFLAGFDYRYLPSDPSACLWFRAEAQRAEVENLASSKILPTRARQRRESGSRAQLARGP
jgi:hypothetical protein